MHRRYFSGKSSQSWLNRHVNDVYVQQAKQQSLRSRSHFKLQEIQANHRLVRPSHAVLDLGSSPGGWSLFVSSLLDNSGKLFCIDLLPMDPVPSAVFIQGDFNDESVRNDLVSHINSSSNVYISSVVTRSEGSVCFHRFTRIKRGVKRYAPQYDRTTSSRSF